MVAGGPATPAASYKMISVQDAQHTILQHTFPLQQQQAPLEQVVGRILGSDVQALDDIPPYRASIKVLRLARAQSSLCTDVKAASCLPPGCCRMATLCGHLMVPESIQLNSMHWPAVPLNAYLRAWSHT